MHRCTVFVGYAWGQHSECCMMWALHLLLLVLKLKMSSVTLKGTSRLP